MEGLFIKILNMSLTASILIAAVMVLRLFMKKAPRWITCLLWAIAAVRLVCPFSIESTISLIPSAEPIPETITMDARPTVNTGIPVINNAVNPVITESFAPAPEQSAMPLQIISHVAARVWVAGAAVLLFYALVSYIVLYKKVRASVTLKDRIKICDDIETPFILGIIRPRIYIPSGISDEQLDNIVSHERAHLKRKDHLWKPLGFLILSVHWFNPFVWAAYILLCRDIELACDEKVVKDMAKPETVSYSETLLSCSTDRRSILVCPLAFGEVGVKARIRHVLNYKKPAFWVIVAAVATCMAVAVFFLTSRENKAAVSDTVLQAGDEPADAGEIAQLTDPIAHTDEIPGAIANALADNSLESAVKKAIIDYFSDGPQKEGTYRAAGFISVRESANLRGMSIAMPDGENEDTISLLGMAMYMEAIIDDTGIHEVSGNHSLAEITFAIEDGENGSPEFRMKGFQPDYGFDLVPVEIADLLKSDMTYLYANSMTCYDQIIRESGISTFQFIGRDLDLLCMYADGSMDNMQNSMSEEGLYRELIYYGEYTLAYREKFGESFSGERKEYLDKACDEIEGIIARGYYFSLESDHGELVYLESHPYVAVTPGEKEFIEAHTVNGRIEIPRLINIDGKLYSQRSDITADISVETPDGVISENDYPIPHVDKSSNFGTGYEYARGNGDEYYVKIDREWYVFSRNGVENLPGYMENTDHAYYANDAVNMQSAGGLTFNGTIIRNDSLDFKEPVVLVRPDGRDVIQYDRVALKLPEGMEEWADASKVGQHVVVTCYPAFQESDPPQGGLIDIYTLE